MAKRVAAETGTGTTEPVRSGQDRSSADARRLPITRVFADGEAVYRFKGRIITAAREIERIEALAIPPAWTDVRIARSPRAKVLAKGYDAQGRTQAIYNPIFRRRRDREKFDRMVRFAEKLPAFRERVDRDLRRRRLGRDRVIACVVRLIDQQYFRVGNTQYASEDGGYGISTLEWKHVSVGTEKVEVDFVGKSGRAHRKTIRDARVARILSRLEELPGPEVFRFFDEDGLLHRLDSRHVNAYVHRHLGAEFTSKDFRTWGGTLAAASVLFEADAAQENQAEAPDAARRRAVKVAAERLGNTPAVAKSSYIDPRVLDAFDEPELVARVRSARIRPRPHQGVDEQRTLRLLRSL